MQLVILGILLTLPAFFSAGEIALLRLRPIKVQRLVEEGAQGSLAIHRLQRRLRRALMVSQLGGTLALITLGWIGKGIIYSWLPDQKASSQILDLGIFLSIVLLATLLRIHHHISI